jgi:ferredoxin
MRFQVDQTKCRSNGVCVEKYPELFRFRPGSKKAIAVDREFPAEQIVDSVAIVRCCPVDAIRVTRSEENTS